MNIFELEILKDNIAVEISSSILLKTKLYKLSDFVKKVDENLPQHLKSAFLADVIDPFFILLSRFSAHGVSIDRSKEILNSAKLLLTFDETSEHRREITSNLDNEISSIESFINKGESSKEEKFNGLFFPVVEITKNPVRKFGSLEKLEFFLEQNKKFEDYFDIIPSTGLIEERLHQQIKTSWSFAKKYLLGHKEGNYFFDIVIKFGQRSVDYTGDSLGAALTLGFIEQLAEFLGLREIIKVTNRVAITGSADESGNIGSVSGSTIKHKLESVFFSYVNMFLVPSENYETVLRHFSEMKEKYPNRDLKIIRIDNINEILLRRDLVSIKKQNIIFWAARKASKPKYLVPLLLGLIIFTTSIFYRKFDDNPVSVYYKNGSVFISNTYGEILWKKPVIGKDEHEANHDRINRLIKIADINHDGINEIVYQSGLLTTTIGDPSFDKLICSNINNEILWTFNFRSKIRDKKEIYEDYFGESILDVYSVNGESEILIGAQIDRYYHNAVFRLNKYGELIGDILWHPGTVRYGAVRDFDNDGNLELAAIGINNGFEGAVLFSIELEKLNGRSPSVGKYRFPDYEIAEFDHYIKLPVSDYIRNLRNDRRYNTPELVHVNEISNNLLFNIIEDEIYKSSSSYILEFYYTFELKEIIVADNFRVKRDSAIVGLDPQKFPLTDSKEFKQSLIDQIAYWNGKDFINIHKWDGKQAGPVDSTTVY